MSSVTAAQWTAVAESRWYRPLGDCYLSINDRYVMQQLTRIAFVLLFVVTLALGGCDLFDSDGGGDAGDAGDSGDGTASVTLALDGAYA
jgi:hypothetical protein